MATRRDIIFAVTDHAVNMTHYSNWVAARVRAELIRLEGRLAELLLPRLAKLIKAGYTAARIREAIAEIRSETDAIYALVVLQASNRAADIIVPEYGFQAVVLRQLGVEPVIAATNQLVATVVKKPLLGKTMRKLGMALGARLREKLTAEIKAGFLQQETIGQIMTRIRGTRKNGYADGVLRVQRHEAEAIARTMVGQYANEARQQFYRDNSDVVKAVEWVSTLDTRTSIMCILRDRKRYTVVGHEPIGHNLDWGGGPGGYHYNCRSTSVPVTDFWESLGVQGPVGRRESVDGPVPATVTYADWFAAQSAERQDEILGPTRGLLYRSGGLKLEDFANNKGMMLNLAQLRRRERAAFEAVGM